MEHDYIQEHHLVDRYVQGRLSEAEADLFEEHYLTCEECVRRLRIAEKFQRGFRQVAAEEAVGIGILAALRSRRGLALGGVFAVLLAASMLLAVRSVRLGSDLEATRTRLAQNRAEEEMRAAEARSEAESLRARLAAEEQARGRLEKEAGRPRVPSAAGAWIVTLVPVRSGPSGEPPAQLVTLPPTRQWIVLVPDLQLEASGTFRVVLERRGGGAVWTGESLRPNPEGSLAIGLDSSLLAPGDYRLRVEEGRGVPVARIAFRAEK